MRSPKPSKKFIFSRRGPELSPELPLVADAAGAFASRDVALSDCRVEGVSMRGHDFGTLRLERTVLERACLAECQFGSMTLRDVRLAGCDLANLETRGLSLVRVEFVNCRMTGFRGGEADCQDVLISEGDQRYSQFRYSRFRGAEFDACNLEEADFQGTDLTGSVFRRCNLRNADMERAKLGNSDLRGSTVEGLVVSPEALRGVVVDPGQAMIFALLLGIRIE